MTPLPTLSLESNLLQGSRANDIFVQAGYSRDRPHILTRHHNCSIVGFSNKDRVALHECDTTFGDSGSPILLQPNGSFHVVAAHVAIHNRSGKGVPVTGKAFHERLQTMEKPRPGDKSFKAAGSNPPKSKPWRKSEETARYCAGFNGVRGAASLPIVRPGHAFQNPLQIAGTAMRRFNRHSA